MKGFVLVFLSIFVIVSCKHLKRNSRKVVKPQYLDKLLKEERYEEFNRLLGIDIPYLSSSRSRIGNSAHHPRFNPDLEHGDILLTPWQKEKARQGMNFSLSPDQKWTYGIVRYYINPHHYDESEKDIITGAFGEMNEKLQGHIHLIPYEGTPDDNYGEDSDDYDDDDYGDDDNWEYNDEDCFTYIFNGSGCYSHMGRTGGQQPLSLETAGCVDHSTTQHEMMHALGFMHEQCRPDRDRYIKVHEENIKPDWRSQFAKSSEGSSTVGPYDYYSAMHYQQRHPDFLVNMNKVAFTVRKKGIDVNRIGYAERLTETDIMKVKNLYPSDPI